MRFTFGEGSGVMEARTCLEIARDGDVAIVSFTGNYIGDVRETAIAAVQLRGYIEANPPRRMVFDFSGVTIVSSWLLSLPLDTRSRSEPRHGEVVTASLREQLQRVFAIAKLDKTFNFCPDRAIAVEKPLESGSDTSL